jgi:hypothetical protein
VPTISSFFGILIRMFYSDHAPPHFHAEYQGERGSFDFAGNLIAGEMRSLVALRLIKEWAGLHVQELQEDWRRSEEGLPMNYIAPLR